MVDVNADNFDFDALSPSVQNEIKRYEKLDTEGVKKMMKDNPARRNHVLKLLALGKAGKDWDAFLLDKGNFGKNGAALNKEQCEKTEKLTTEMACGLLYCVEEEKKRDKYVDSFSKKFKDIGLDSDFVDGFLTKYKTLYRAFVEAYRTFSEEDKAKFANNNVEKSSLDHWISGMNDGLINQGALGYAPDPNPSCAVKECVGGTAFEEGIISTHKNATKKSGNGGNDGGLNTAAIAGIAVGSVVLIGTIIALIIWLKRRNGQQAKI